MTPFFFSSTDRLAIMLYAPRILNENTGWRSSRLIQIYGRVSFRVAELYRTHLVAETGGEVDCIGERCFLEIEGRRVDLGWAGECVLRHEGG